MVNPIIAFDGKKVRVILEQKIVVIDTESQSVKVSLREEMPGGDDRLIELPLSSSGPSLTV